MNSHHNIKIHTSILITITLLFIGCTQDQLVPNKTYQKNNNSMAEVQFDTSHITFDINSDIAPKDDTKKVLKILKEIRSAKTRGIRLDENGKIDKDQDFEAICYIKKKNENEKNTLGRFSLKWKIEEDNNKLKLTGKTTRVITIEWIKGKKPNNFTSEDWEVCGLGGGGKSKKVKSFEAVSFMLEDLQGVDKSSGIEALPILSNYQKIETKNRKYPLLKFKFKLFGTLLKIKLKRDKNVSYDKDFYLTTTALVPTGIFYIEKPFDDSPDKNNNFLQRWSPIIPKEYLPVHKKQNESLEGEANESLAVIKLTHDKAQEIDTWKNGKNEKYYLWYIWGMPGEFSVGETTMGSLSGGYIIKSSKKNAKGPLYSRHSYKEDNGKIKTLNVEMHKPEPYPSFFFLNPLERIAPHNLASAKTFKTNDLADNIPNDGNPKYNASDKHFFNDTDGMLKKLYPEGYHLPTYDEMAILFPSPQESGEDLLWWTERNGSFSDKKRKYTEWLTLYAKQIENGNKWYVCDNQNMADSPGYNFLKEPTKDRNIKGFTSYFWNKKGDQYIYAIRFEGNEYYNDKIRCAYRYKMLNLNVWRDNPLIKERQMIVTSRWIGDAPITIDDIANDDWWEHNKEYNVIRKLPAEGFFTSRGLTGAGQAGCYLTAGYYLFDNYWSQWYRMFDADWKYGSFQRKKFDTKKGLIRPITNTMMCNEKAGEENTGNGTGQTYSIPQNHYNR